MLNCVVFNIGYCNELLGTCPGGGGGALRYLNVFLCIEHRSVHIAIIIKYPVRYYMITIKNS